MALNLNFSVNKTICGCDGAITLVASGGYTPYSYSIDGGVTYKNSPIFTNMCGGNYIAVVVDLSGQTTNKLVTIDNPSGKTTYFVSLLTSDKILSTTNTLQIKEYNTTLQVTPTLPNNVYITFDILRTSTLNSSPSFSSATKTSTSILTYNSSAITYSYSGQVTGETYNTIPGCQNYTLYTDSLTEVWSNLSYSNGDSITITTIDYNYKNNETICYIGDSYEVFSIGSLKIFNCNCCNVTQI